MFRVGFPIWSHTFKMAVNSHFNQSISFYVAKFCDFCHLVNAHEASARRICSSVRRSLIHSTLLYLSFYKFENHSSATILQVRYGQSHSCLSQRIPQPFNDTHINRSSFRHQSYPLSVASFTCERQDFRRLLLDCTSTSFSLAITTPTTMMITMTWV